MLLNDFISISSIKYASKKALICPSGEFTYSEVNQKVKTFSQYLLDNSIMKSDRIAVYLENSFESVISIFGIIYVGGVFVVINPLVKPQKLVFMLNDCKSKMLITDKRHFDEIKNYLDQCDSLEKVFLTDFDKNEQYAIDNSTELMPFCSQSESHTDSICGFPNTIDVDIAAIIYTSGSTGFPKGVVLTHRNMVFAADSIINYLKNTSEDVLFNVLPLSFDYGLYQLLMTFRFGGTLVLERRFGFPHSMLKLMEKHHVTGFPIVPTIANILLRMDNLDNYDLSSLRYITNTAQRLPKKTIYSLLDVFSDVDIYSMYGLTECKRVSFLPPEKIRKKPDSVGQAIPGTEVFLVDEKGNKIDRPDVVGELVVRGNHIMLGYWNNKEATDNIIKKGGYIGDRWLYTGDYFKMDEEGDLYFYGRKDDMIKTAGEKVSPKEIENVLYELDGIQEAAVIDVPDDLLGCAIKAVVSLKKGDQLTADQIIQFCLIRLEKFMVPKYVEILNELPKTETGKISKKRLKET